MNERSDLVAGVESDADDHVRVTRRRLVRWVTVLAVGTVAILAVWQDSLV
jgi:hypothetical protein